LNVTYLGKGIEVFENSACNIEKHLAEKAKMFDNFDNNGNYIDETVKYVDVKTQQTIGYGQGSCLKHSVLGIH
jgi:hypothetical protein